jgi:hypothetical protein
MTVAEFRHKSIFTLISFVDMTDQFVQKVPESAVQCTVVVALIHERPVMPAIKILIFYI